MAVTLPYSAGQHVLLYMVCSLCHGHSCRGIAASSQAGDADTSCDLVSRVDRRGIDDEETFNHRDPHLHLGSNRVKSLVSKT